MIEILNENRASANKIFRDMNEEEKECMAILLANEMPALCLRAVAEAIQDDEKRMRAMSELATRKYEV